MVLKKFSYQKYLAMVLKKSSSHDDLIHMVVNVLSQADMVLKKFFHELLNQSNQFNHMVVVIK